MPSLVVTLVGPDRPGLVGIVSDVVREHGGNWRESRMSHLAGQFAGIILVDVPDSEIEALVDGLKGLHGQGLKIVTEVDTATEAAAPFGILWDLSVIGNDRPGIVREVTRVLTAHDVNVEELTSECTEAPHGGGQIFRASVRLRIPAGLSSALLQDELENIATDLMIDFSQDSETAQSG